MSKTTHTNIKRASGLIAGAAGLALAAAGLLAAPAAFGEDGDSPSPEPCPTVTEPATPSLTVTPSTVLYRGEFQLSATGLGCRQAVEAVLSGDSGSSIPLATLTADSDGSVTATLAVPDITFAPSDYNVVLLDPASNTVLASAPLRVETENGCPSLIQPIRLFQVVAVTPGEAWPGGTVRITVANGYCKQELRLVLRPGDVPLAQMTADLDGNAEATATLPADLAPGTYAVTLVNQSGTELEFAAPASLTVLGGPNSATPTPTGGMPRAATDVPDQGGGGPAPWLAAGAALVLAAWGGAWIRRLALRR